MTNSLLLFIGTLAFLAFGYASLVRIAYKTYFNTTQVTPSEALPKLNQLLVHLGQGGLFIHFATLSLLLFWGWGIALLWLAIFHLIAETLWNVQQSNTARLFRPNKTKKNTKIKTTVATQDIPDENNGLINFIQQLFFMLLVSVGVALLVELINQQSGLVFILLAIVIAHHFICEELTPITIAKSLAVIFCGFWFSHELGISVFGSVTLIDHPIPRDYFAWLSFDHSNLIALALIFAVFMLTQRDNFNSDVSILSGAFVMLLLCILMVKFIWLRPIMDAPLNSLQLRSEGLPPFSSLALFMFAGLGLLFLGKEPSDNSATDVTLRKHFASLQLANLIILLISILLIFALASALGIGAWSTHFQDWSTVGNLTTQLKLAMRSAVDLINSQAGIGTLSYSLFSSVLAVIGFSYLLNVTAQFISITITQADKDTTEEANLFTRLKSSRSFLIFIVYVISSTLIVQGISIDFWMLIGMLAWLLVTNKIITACHVPQENRLGQLVQNSLALLLIIFGAIQLVWTLVLCTINQQWLFNIAISLILIAAIYSWKDQIKPLITPFKQNNEGVLFK